MLRVAQNGVVAVSANFLEEKGYLLEIEKVLVTRFTTGLKEGLLLGLLLYLARMGIFSFSLQGEYGSPDLQSLFPGEDVSGLLQELHLVQVVHSPTMTLCEDSFYLSKYYALQNTVVQELIRLVTSHPLQIQGFIPEEKMSEEQVYAIESALQHPLMLISGGPGTGKSFVGTAIVHAFLQSQYKSIVVTAPTGKAVAQLQERMGIQPAISYTTLHALLKWNKNGARRKTPIPANLILLDEASMVPLPLFAELLMQVGKDTHLVIMGDKNQLPPVEGGSCFAELLQADLPKAFLSKVFRNEKTSLHSLAHQTLLGKVPQFSTLPERNNCIEMLWREFLCPWYDSLLGKVPQEIWKSLYKFMILSPLRQGPWGTEALNAQLYEKAKAYFLEKELTSFFPIVFLQNDHKKGIVNGARALLYKQASSEEQEKILLENGEEITLSAAPQFSLSFTLSIHKSQGSECEHVCLLIPPGSEDFSREVVYTGITRAKSQVQIYADKDALCRILDKTVFHGKQLGVSIDRAISCAQK